MVTQQLSFMSQLYEYEEKEKNFIVNVTRLINNLRYFRVMLESRIGVVSEKSKEHKELVYLNNKIGYCLYWLGTLGYLGSKDTNLQVEKSESSWYAKTENKGYYSSPETRSMVDLYKYMITIKSLSNRFKIVSADRLKEIKLADKVLDCYFASLNELYDGISNLTDTRYV